MLHLLQRGGGQGGGGGGGGGREKEEEEEGDEGEKETAKEDGESRAALVRLWTACLFRLPPLTMRIHGAHLAAVRAALDRLVGWTLQRHSISPFLASHFFV